MLKMEEALVWGDPKLDTLDADRLILNGRILEGRYAWSLCASDLSGLEYGTLYTIRSSGSSSSERKSTASTISDPWSISARQKFQRDTTRMDVSENEQRALSNNGIFVWPDRTSEHRAHGAGIVCTRALFAVLLESRSRACVTLTNSSVVQSSPGSENGLPERDGLENFNVFSLEMLHTPTLSTTATHSSKQVLEIEAKSFKRIATALEPSKRIAAVSPTEPTGSRVWIKCRSSKLVVLLFLLRVAQYVIRFLQLVELLLGSLFLVDVWVLLDFLVLCSSSSVLSVTTSFPSSSYCRLAVTDSAPSLSLVNSLVILPFGPQIKNPTFLETYSSKSLRNLIHSYFSINESSSLTFIKFSFLDSHLARKSSSAGVNNVEFRTIGCLVASKSGCFLFSSTSSKLSGNRSLMISSLERSPSSIAEMKACVFSSRNKMACDLRNLVWLFGALLLWEKGNDELNNVDCNVLSCLRLESDLVGSKFCGGQKTSRNASFKKKNPRSISPSVASKKVARFTLRSVPSMVSSLPRKKSGAASPYFQTPKVTFSKVKNGLSSELYTLFVVSNSSIKLPKAIPAKESRLETSSIIFWYGPCEMILRICVAKLSRTGRVFMSS
ncbi:hypothetical protein OGAPHI_005368 [Ogataea philodendri]|uniref:Uncharacterized protein n=1 Tax=Ogataea philodendri TaxID=1378263 RepID=A0A9P8T213_9ASCO|nr:uncharacterized protein OGAPHI_005368 [Ogataea philodendri]KAH3663378.1 hypothetical protein OGAPHI_005368 [Ogataea philodendri]